MNWLWGRVTNSQERVLIEEAEEDPFLAEAMEGYELFPESDHIQTITRLKQKLRNRNKRSYFKPWSIAASIIFIVGAGLIIWSLNPLAPPQLSDNILQKELKPSETTNTFRSRSKETTLKNLPEDSESQISAPKGSSVPNPAPPNPGQRANGPTHIKLNRREKTPPYLAEHKIEPAKKSKAISSPRVAKPIHSMDEEVLAPKPRPQILDETPQMKEEIAYDNVASTGSVSPKVVTIGKAIDATKDSLQFFPGSSIQTISGRITSPSGQPIIGAIVFSPSTEKSVLTDDLGRFDLEYPTSNPKLAIKSSNFRTEAISINQVDTLDIIINAELLGGSSLRKSKNSIGNYYFQSEENAKTIIPPAKPEGGFQQFQAYIEKEMKYPSLAIENKVEGTVEIQFTIKKNGNLTNFKVLKGLGYGCEQEAIRLLDEGPKWKFPIGYKKWDATYKVEFNLK